jgi:hypothetical protein
MNNVKIDVDNWYLSDKSPSDGDVVLFQPKEECNRDNVVYAGVYVASEKMFYIGFEESGDFLFSFDVKRWIKMNEFLNG